MPSPVAANADDETSKKLTVLVFFHGGGFCVGSFDLPNTQACCLGFAGELPSAVICADYRLAPEHRLPAALDAQTVLSWIRKQATGAAGGDPWLAESAHFQQVFITGDSAGGNIAHHVAVTLGSGEFGVVPALIAGYVLFWPFVAGVLRTASEAEYPPGPFLTLPVSGQLRRLSLPIGATTDHPVLNLFGPQSPALDAVALPPMLVMGGEHGLLRGRIVDYVMRLKAMRSRSSSSNSKSSTTGFSS